MIRITAPRLILGASKFIGIQFRDGVAQVEDLHPEIRQALEQHGYTIEEEIAAVALEDLTVRELRDIAEVEGIELPARASKAELVDLISRSGFAVFEGPDGTVIGDGESIATLPTEFVAAAWQGDVPEIVAED